MGTKKRGERYAFMGVWRVNISVLTIPSLLLVIMMAGICADGQCGASIQNMHIYWIPLIVLLALSCLTCCAFSCRSSDDSDDDDDEDDDEAVKVVSMVAAMCIALPAIVACALAMGGSWPAFSFIPLMFFPATIMIVGGCFTFCVNVEASERCVFWSSLGRYNWALTFSSLLKLPGRWLLIIADEWRGLWVMMHHGGRRSYLHIL